VRVDLDVKVRTRDGESAGSVQRAIVDPRANEVTDFVISTGGVFGQDVLVPRERLEAASREGDSIRLDFYLDELRQMPRYEPADYTVPATGWVPPIGYAYPVAGFVWPAGYLWPGEPAAAPRRDVFDGEVSPAIEKGTAMRGRAGDEIGVVDDVRFDPDTGGCKHWSCAPAVRSRPSSAAVRRARSIARKWTV
jgi:sporulation protein YlmC with PRC-barrel domain